MVSRYKSALKLEDKVLKEWVMLSNKDKIFPFPSVESPSTTNQIPNIFPIWSIKITNPCTLGNTKKITPKKHNSPHSQTPPFQSTDQQNHIISNQPLLHKLTRQPPHHQLYPTPPPKNILTPSLNILPHHATQTILQNKSNILSHRPLFNPNQWRPPRLGHSTQRMALNGPWDHHHLLGPTPATGEPVQGAI